LVAADRAAAARARITAEMLVKFADERRDARRGASPAGRISALLAS
jgi:hypothetical protein